MKTSLALMLALTLITNAHAAKKIDHTKGTELTQPYRVPYAIKRVCWQNPKTQEKTCKTHYLDGTTAEVVTKKRK